MGIYKIPAVPSNKTTPLKGIHAMGHFNDERRANPRAQVFRPLIYQSDIYPRIRLATTKDLSARGARIENTSSLYDQEWLSLWLAFESRVIHCRGKVVHVQRFDERSWAGICFEFINDEDRIALTEYVSHLLEKKDQPEF